MYGKINFLSHGDNGWAEFFFFGKPLVGTASINLELCEEFTQHRQATVEVGVADGQGLVEVEERTAAVGLGAAEHADGEGKLAFE